MQVLLANPRGFCAGVDRAIDIVERALELFGPPIHVRHEVVHNRHVVERLRGLGAVFVDELAEVPAGGTVIFSAHGVSSAVEEAARARRLTVFDATCPLVTKVHMEVQRYARDGCDVVLIGHAGHPEVEGTMGRFDGSWGGRIHLVQNIADVGALAVRDPEHLASVTQTTLSVDDTAEIVAALRRRFPALATPRREDICYATQNRQASAKTVAGAVDVLLVIGAANIAARIPGGGPPVSVPETVTHRRAGRHLPGAGRSRRDPRRTRWATRRALREPWPAVARPDQPPGSRSPATTAVEDPPTAA